MELFLERQVCRQAIKHYTTTLTSGLVVVLCGVWLLFKAPIIQVKSHCM